MFAGKTCRSIIFSSLVALSACAIPATNPPSLNAEEVGGERTTQARLVAEHNLKLEKERATEMLDFQKRLMMVGSEIAGSGTEVCLEMNQANKDNSCVYSFEIYGADEEKAKKVGINAFADGKKIYVTKPMMRFASKDDELALVLAHEYSHNIMGHISSQKQNMVLGAIAGALIDGLAASRGYNTQGDFTKIGAEAATLSYSKAFETEADYVGMYILARAGRNYKSAPELWRKLSLKQPDAIYISTTHPSNPERFVLMEKVVQEINQKKKLKEPLLPNLKPKET